MSENQDTSAKFDVFAKLWRYLIDNKPRTAFKHPGSMVKVAYCETIIREVDPSIIPKWKPAQNNGETCSQKLKIKTYIHFE
jgi:hypothetical protein